MKLNLFLYLFLVILIGCTSRIKFYTSNNNVLCINEKSQMIYLYPSSSNAIHLYRYNYSIFKYELNNNTFHFKIDSSELSTEINWCQDDLNIGKVKFKDVNNNRLQLTGTFPILIINNDTLNEFSKYDFNILSRHKKYKITLILRKIVIEDSIYGPPTDSIQDIGLNIKFNKLNREIDSYHVLLKEGIMHQLNNELLILNLSFFNNQSLSDTVHSTKWKIKHKDWLYYSDYGLFKKGLRN